jgi:nucleoid-associated protein YgaU
MAKTESNSIVNISLTVLSIILIILGLIFIIAGIKDIVVNNWWNNVKTDNVATADINLGISTTRVPGDKNSSSDNKNPNNSGAQKANENIQKMVETGKWRATDYVKGDISNGSYTVKKGDTLWEIAEAVYGSGFEWKKILDKNSSKIGYLPNGSRALIFPGQVLDIP